MPNLAGHDSEDMISGLSVACGRQCQITRARAGIVSCSDLVSPMLGAAHPPQITRTVPHMSLKFPFRAAEAQPRHIIDAVKRAWVTNVSRFDKVSKFTVGAWSGLRHAYVLDIPDTHSVEKLAIETPSQSIHRVHLLAVEHAVNLSLKSEIETYMVQVFYSWRQVAVENRFEAWYDTVIGERDEIATVMATVEESNKQLSAQLRSLDRLRGLSEKELQSANSTVRGLWQELNGMATQMNVTKAENECLRQELQDLRRELQTSSTVVNVLRADCNTAKTEVNKLEAQLIKLQTGCVVCMTMPSVIAFVPCGHLATCQECARNLSSPECPICREFIVQELYVFTP